jgi:hypothetical protein
MKNWANELNRALSKEEVQMAKKHAKKYSTSMAIKEMQIKATLRFHLTLQEHKQQQMLVRMWGERKSYMLVVEMKVSTSTMENSMKAPQKTKNRTAIDSSIPLLVLFLKKCKSGYNKGTCLGNVTKKLPV